MNFAWTSPVKEKNRGHYVFIGLQNNSKLLPQMTKPVYYGTSHRNPPPEVRNGDPYVYTVPTTSGILAVNYIIMLDDLLSKEAVLR